MENSTGRLPTVLFVGYGRAGKDFAAAYLATITKLRYGGSASWAGLPHMARVLGIHPQLAWDTRHENREVWKRELDKLREGDQTCLARLALAQGEIVTGLRDREEMHTVKAKGLFTHIVWVHRPGPVDETVTFYPWDADFQLDNCKTLPAFREGIRAMAVELGLPML